MSFGSARRDTKQLIAHWSDLLSPNGTTNAAFRARFDSSDDEEAAAPTAEP